MATSKKINLNQNKQLKLLLVGVLVLLFAGVASYLINFSSAASSDVVGVYSTQQADVSVPGVTNVQDYIGPATQVLPGSTLGYYGKGGGTFVQTKNCYIMRAVDGDAVVVLMAAKGAKKLTIPKSDLYHEYCVSSGKLTADGAVKVVSGSKVNVHLMEYFYYFTE